MLAGSHRLEVQGVSEVDSPEAGKDTFGILHFGDQVPFCKVSKYFVDSAAPQSRNLSYQGIWDDVMVFRTHFYLEMAD